MKRLLSHLLVGLSGSEGSIQAAKYAILLARQFDAQVSAVYVVDTATISRLTISKIFIEDEASHFRSSLEQNGKRYLDFTSELAASKGIQLHKQLRYGPIATELLVATRELKSDCLVLGSWQQTHASWDLLSAAYREIFLHANCPILLAQEPDIEDLWNNDKSIE